MSGIKFGSKFEITVSPMLILDIEGLLEEWVDELFALDEIDLEREAIGMAQKIVVHMAKGVAQSEREG